MPFWNRKKDTQVGVLATLDSTERRPASIQSSVQASEVSDSRSQASTAKNSLEVKENRLGLFVFKDQDDNDPDVVDIVAIHGLNGHWEKTWQTTTRRGDQVVWLRDFLPQQIPHARIMSFGYDSVLQFSKSVAHIGTFAEQLLEDLVSRRMGLAARRPIIFVCHSLGGIVVKKAIVRANEKDRYKSLLDSVRGIVFFGTPHTGSALASWSTLLSNVASAASLGVKTNKRLSKDLESKSLVLQEISKSFADRAKSLQLISFYETDRMDFLNCRVVEEGSAILGFSDEVTIPINGNHQTMCRFETIDEQRYRCVWTNLQNIAGSAKLLEFVEGETNENIDSEDDDLDIVGKRALNTTNAKQKEPLDTLNEQTLTLVEKKRREVEKEKRADEERRNAGGKEARKAKKEARKARTACYRALCNSEYEAHRNRNPTAVPGTCQWLLHHEIYRGWRLKQASNLLWLSADPGCGKSVLTSYLVEHLKNADNKLQVPEIVCFFFFKEDSNEQDNAPHAISALLHQLYTTQPWLLQHATKPFIAEGRAILDQFSTLWSILMASVKDTRSRDILLILDGLDECELVTRHQLLQSLVRFYKAEHNNLNESPFVKTIISSRPDNDIKIAFDMLPTIRLRGEDEPEAISKDVELVIQDHIEKAILRGLPRSILGDLKAGLIKGADRTFLWTTMVIDLLEAKKGASKRELLEILQSRDIYRIYHRLLEDSSDQEEARRLLHIVVAAVRPLTLAEMSIAMSVNPSQQSFEELELDIVYNFEERVKALCGNFIRIVHSTIYLVHQTAREFLLLENKDQPPKFGKWQHSIILREAHSQLLDICLQYLAFLNVKSSQPSPYALDNNIYTTQFVEYASRFWTHHYLELAPLLTESQLAKCAQLCNSRSLGFSRWYKSASTSARNPKHELREGTIQRDIAYHLGLDQVVELMDRLIKPTDLEWVDEKQAVLSATEADDKQGSRNIRTSLRPRDPNEIVQPHTISPGHWRASPLSLAMVSGSSLNANPHSESLSNKESESCKLESDASNLGPDGVETDVG